MRQLTDRVGARDHPDFLDGTQACAAADPEIFYPARHNAAADLPARKMCRLCPLTTACLDWALAADQRYGIWGDTTPRERSNILRGNRPASLPDSQRQEECNE